MSDLRFALRQLLKNPGFTVVAVLTLALGLGANTAIFAVINSLVLRSLPVQEPSRLAQASRNGVNGRAYTFTYPAYQRLRNGGKSFSGLLAAGNIGQGRMVASGMGGTEIEMVHPQPVTGNFFSVLGVQPFLGRLLAESDDGPNRAERVVVISHGYWQRRFGSDPSVLGKAITLLDVPVEIVGVTPPGFFGILPGENPDLWVPINLMPQIQPQALGEGYDWLGLIGRLRPGTEFGQAQAELASAFQQYRAELGAAASTQDHSAALKEEFELRPAPGGWTRLYDRIHQSLTILIAVAGVVLLVACANLASLLLARGVARGREFSIRTALGAHPMRLMRQLLTESLLLAGLGGLAGLIIAHWTTRLLVSFLRVQTGPLSLDAAMDGRVLCFTLGLILVVGLVFGLAPALRASRSELTTGRLAPVAGLSVNRLWFQQYLVVAQVSLAVVLLVGAGLFARTLQKLKGADRGFARDNIVLLEVGFKRRIDGARRILAYKELLRRLEDSPGVRSASMSRITPLTENTWGQRIDIEGYAPGPDEIVRCSGMSVAEHYFQTMGTPLLGGRDFGPQDERLDPSTAANPLGVAIINESLARKYFAHANPLGRRFSLFGKAQKFGIIGVVGDAKYRSLREPVPPVFYLFCFGETRDWDMTFAVRAAGDGLAVKEELRRAVVATGLNLQLQAVRTMDEVVDASLQRERLIANLTGLFSFTALALACLGLYGTVSFAVAQRTREIGVRLALGSSRREVLMLVIGQGLSLALIGSAIGLAGALGITRLVARLLYGVSPLDPLTFGCVLLLLVGIAIFSSWLPARRATKIDPMEALRYE